ncbi:MAG: hypothetical protein Q4B45_06925 [Coriobacteriia bacterium]|nr:hypothetical protein [Coriobacteriia bacterium]
MKVACEEQGATEEISGAMVSELKQHKSRPVGIGIAVPPALEPYLTQVDHAMCALSPFPAEGCRIV